MQPEQRAISPIGSPAAGDVLGVSVATISRWVDTGYLPAVRRGSRGRDTHLFDPAVVADLARRRAEAKRVLDWQHGAIA